MNNTKCSGSGNLRSYSVGDARNTSGSPTGATHARVVCPTCHKDMIGRIVRTVAGRPVGSHGDNDGMVRVPTHMSATPATAANIPPAVATWIANFNAS